MGYSESSPWDPPGQLDLHGYVAQHLCLLPIASNNCRALRELSLKLPLYDFLHTFCFSE